MLAQVLFSGKCLITDFTGEWCGTFMHKLDVIGQASSAVESFATNFTMKTIFTGVVEYVGSELGWLDKRFVAVLANMGLLSGVGSLVTIKGLSCSKFLLTLKRWKWWIFTEISKKMRIFAKFENFWGVLNGKIAGFQKFIFQICQFGRIFLLLL